MSHISALSFSGATAPYWKKLHDFPDSKDSLKYEDYLKESTVGNASEFRWYGCVWNEDLLYPLERRKNYVCRPCNHNKNLKKRSDKETRREGYHMTSNPALSVGQKTLRQNRSKWLSAFGSSRTRFNRFQKASLMCWKPVYTQWESSWNCSLNEASILMRIILILWTKI